MQVAFAAITLTLIVFLPESPRWLAAHGQVSAARDVLHRLDGSESEKARAVSVDLQMGEILEAIELERAAGSAGFATCFKMGDQRFFHRVFLGMASQFAQQICGINLITYYAPSIFENSVGLSRVSAAISLRCRRQLADHSRCLQDLSLLLSGFNGVAYFLSSLVPIPLIERVGRRKLMIFSAAGQTVAMAILAATTADPGNSAKGIVAAVMLFVFNFFFVRAHSLKPFRSITLTPPPCRPADSSRSRGCTVPRSAHSL